MKKIDKILIRFVLAFCAIPAFTVSCSDEPLPENYYTFTGEMVSDYLQNRSGEFSDFLAIVQRYGMNWVFKVWTNLQRNNVIPCHGTILSTKPISLRT